jgi:hypothetical protein
MQYVMEIADLSGAWHLELSMPENRMGYIATQQKRQPDKPLRVEFFLATNPSVRYFGTVKEIHNRAEVRSDSGGGAMSGGTNMVSIKVALDDQSALSLSTLRPGAACSARIDCGYKPLGYAMFYEVIAFVQKNVWFRWF